MTPAFTLYGVLLSIHVIGWNLPIISCNLIMPAESRELTGVQSGVWDASTEILECERCKWNCSCLHSCIPKSITLPSGYQGAGGALSSALKSFPDAFFFFWGGGAGVKKIVCGLWFTIANHTYMNLLTRKNIFFNPHLIKFSPKEQYLHGANHHLAARNK